MSRTELSERKEKILSAVIERFIATGEPVGSKFLAAALAVRVSPATVRNDMALLSELGFLEQPYTSAGRIPSDKGYRYYIDRLLNNYTPSDAEMFRIVSSIDYSEGDSSVILSQVCEVLSALTGCCAAAASPHCDNPQITSAQAVRLTPHSAMVLATTSAGITKGRTARLEREFDYTLAELFYNVTAANFTGADCAGLTPARLQSVTAGLGDMALDMTPLMISFFEAAREAAGVSITAKGQSRLLELPELSESAVDILELLKNRAAAASLLSMNSSDRVILKIGAENEFACLRNAALVKASYSVGENAVGTIGVIGSTKMDYSRVIPLVKYISGITGSKLSQLADD